MSYFNFFEDNASNEFATYNQATHEFIEMMGIPVKFLPRTAVEQDDLFGDDYLSSFDETVECKMYLEDSTSFGGQNDLFAKFGLEVDDTVTLKVQQDHMIELLNGDDPEIGDLIQFVFNNQIFEITHVEDEEIFYLTGKQTTFTFKCRRWRYSGEQMNTGEIDIDKIDDEDTSTLDDSIQEFEQVLNFDETDPFDSGW